MNIYKMLFSAIERLSEEYLQHWINLCNIESPTDYKPGVDAVGEYAIAIAQKHGWRVEKQPQSVSGDCVCITMNPDAGKSPIALSGHIDTVHPLGSFGSPAVHVEGDKIFGPGVSDCKGGVAAALLAMAALEECGFTDRPVLLLLQTDEETGSRGSGKSTIGWICDKAHDAVAFLNCEGYTAGHAVLWRKGISRYRFTVTGKPVHASNCQDGVSAIAEAAYKIIELEKLKDKNGLTCSCGLISGGTSENTVPETCTFTVDIRYSNDEEMAEGDRIVTEIAKHSYLEGSHTEVALTSRRVAMKHSERNLKLFDRMNEIYRSCGLPQLTALRSNGGSDAADVTAYGIPCVDSFGVQGGYIHTTDEFAYISSLAEAARRIAAVVCSL